MINEYGFYIIYGDFSYFVFWRNLTNSILIILCIFLIFRINQIYKNKKIIENTVHFINQSCITSRWNNKGTITFNDLSVYIGKLQYHIPHGKGLFKHKDFGSKKLKFICGESTTIKIFKDESGYQYLIKDPVKAELNKPMRFLLKYFFIFSCIVLIFGIAELPYGYYVILKFIVSITFGMLAFNFYKANKMKSLLTASLFIIIYNPVVPLHFNKEFWIAVNMTTVGLLIILYRINRI
jgi:hypothetical protein